MALAFLALFASACAHAAEERVLQEFFDASRLHNETLLVSIATVVFDSTADGVVTSFTVTSVGPEDRKTLGTDSKAAKIAALSVAAARPDLKVSEHKGELISESVKLSAPVALANGQTARKTISVILSRAQLTGDVEVTGRWIVTGFSSY